MNPKKTRTAINKQIEYIREDRDGLRQKMIRLDRILFGALLTIIFVLLGEMLSITGSKGLEVSALAFSIAIPCLAMSIFSQELNSIYGFSLKAKLKMFLSLLGAVTTLAGVGGAFWHLSPTAAYLFIVFSVTCFIVVLRYHIHIGIAYEMEVDKMN